MKTYLEMTKWYFVAVFAVAAFQAALVSFELYRPPAIDPFGVAKILIVIGFVWNAAKKSDFTIQQAAVSGALLFAPTLLFIVTGFLAPQLPEDMGTVLKILTLFVFITVNLALYGIIGLLTAIVAGKKA